MLDQVFWGNSLKRWIAAAAILLAAVVVGRILSAIAQSIGKRFKSPFLGAMAGSVGAPITAFVFIFGLRIAAESLIIPGGVKTLLEKGVTLLSVVVMTWFVANCYDAIHNSVFVPWAKRPDTNVDLHLFVVLRTFVNVIIWLVGIASALNSIGFEVSAILAGIGLGGMALALASQDTVANVFGGVLVLTQRPFKVGERIDVAGINGWVTQFGLRNTILTNWYGRRVLVPNKKFTDSVVVNIDTQQVYYQEARLRIDPTTPPAKLEEALAILREIVAADDLLDKTPWVMLDRIDHGFYEIEFWYAILRWRPTEASVIPNEYEKICRAKTRVNLAVLRRFEAAGIRFAVPLEVHVPGDPKHFLAPPRSAPPSPASSAG